MKKILLIIFLFFSIIHSANAHISHYKNLKKIEMEILRNNKIIGYNYFFFKREKDLTLITNQFKFETKVLGITVFEVEGFSEEKYYKDALISFKSKTKQNKKDKYVDLTFDKKNNEFIINGSSYSGKAKTNNIIGNWWNHKILQSESQISPISGSIKKQTVTFIGKEKVKIYEKTFDTEHFKLKSTNQNLPEEKKLNFDIWFDKKTGLIVKVKYSRMGEWEYRLKNFE